MIPGTVWFHPEWNRVMSREVNEKYNKHIKEAGFGLRLILMFIQVNFHRTVCLTNKLIYPRFDHSYRFRTIELAQSRCQVWTLLQLDVWLNMESVRNFRVVPPFFKKRQLKLCDFNFESFLAKNKFIELLLSMLIWLSLNRFRKYVNIHCARSTSLSCKAGHLGFKI
mgnify:CR=1 FL=1